MDQAAPGSRVEQLLEEGNALRREAIALQREALAAQREVLEETRRNLARAGEVNERALAVSRLARRIQLAALPLILLLVGYVSWLLFFKLGI